MHSERHADGHWSGDLLIADWDDLEKSIASEVHVKRTESQDVQVTRPHVTDHSSKRNTWYLDLFAIDKFEKKDMKREATPMHKSNLHLPMKREATPYRPHPAKETSICRT